MAEVYYFVSDLHVGGDEQLQEAEFESEFVAFLERLADRDEDAELIILGDAFGLWEFTEVEGLAKFDRLVENHPGLFEQFCATGERIDITLIPGNHDAELAGYRAYVDRLAEYNVTLDATLSLERPVAGRTVWIEHGMQHDPNNRMPDFGNPRANPLGYFVNRHVTSKAGQLSGHGKYNWLKDIQSMTPLEEIPTWLLSNYYYREMSPFLRYAALPFLLLFNVSVLYLAILLLEGSGVLGTTVVTDATTAFLRLFGLAGDLVAFVFAVNAAVVLLLILISIPLYVLVRDVKRTLERFGISFEGAAGDRDAAYLDAARDVFAERPDVAVYVYGHTHRASLTRLDERVVINTGTWLKRLHRVSPRIGLLPPIYRPSFRLNYFRISEEAGDVLVEYETVEKEARQELSFLQRLLAERRPPAPEIPDRTVVAGSPDDREESAVQERAADGQSTDATSDGDPERD
ncbi:metallophosphoesterase [Halomicrococcus gelatinilyticus]|uniref:metallophosphoesterase n=1 Tax=Halomicrococcus gelatinilyticus TaxID=1702103 RepID=UPI002E15F435